MFECNVIFVYNTPKKTDCSKTNFFNAVIFEKNDITGQNNVTLRNIYRSSITEKVQQVQISSPFFYFMYLQLLCEATEEFF